MRRSTPKVAGPVFLTFTVPLVPPGVNHYVKHTRSGRHYVSAEAKQFKADMAVFVGFRHVVGQFFHVEATIYLGAKQKGDVDGFAKVLLDSLADLRVFRTLKKGIPEAVSDAHVIELHLRKRRDEENPRTEITVKAILGVTL